MRRALASLLLLALLTFSNCGGGGGASASAPTTAPPVAAVDNDILHYALWLKPWQGTFTGGIWTVRPISATESNLWWATDYYERFRLGSNPTDGREWIWLCAYGMPDVHREYVLTVRKAELIHGDGRVEDVTPPAGTQCQPYIPRFPESFIVVRVSGDVHPDALSCVLDGTCANLTQFFHQAEYTGPISVLNAGWTGDDTKTRPSFRQREVYWDNNRNGRVGWGIGSGSIGANGLPDGVVVTYGQEQTYGFGVGFVWTRNTYPDPTNPNAGAGSVGWLITSVPQ